MANKRDLKKYIRNTCGALAGEILLARAAFPAIERKTVHDIINEIAILQGRTLSKVAVAYDNKSCRKLDAASYNNERRKYFAKAYDSLLEEFDASVLEVVKKMNAALPADVREAIKEAAAE